MNLGDTDDGATLTFMRLFLNYFGSNGVLAVEAAMTIRTCAGQAMSEPCRVSLQALGPGNDRVQPTDELSPCAVHHVDKWASPPERWTFASVDRRYQQRHNYVVVQRNLTRSTGADHIVNGVHTTELTADTTGNYADAVKRGQRTMFPWPAWPAAAFAAGRFHRVDGMIMARAPLRFNNVNVGQDATSPWPTSPPLRL